MDNQLGIMQGRLSPPIDGRIQAFPRETWEKEFYQAEEIGFDFIDWIIEADGLHENPLLTKQGQRAIRSLISKTGIQIGAVCADYFMDCPLIRCSTSELEQRLDVLASVLSHMNHLGLKYLEMPFVDNAAIQNEKELGQVIELFKPRLDMAYELGVTIAFETSLRASMFKDFLSRLDHPAARANYDMGNSASLGYSPREELEAYGELVVTVHVKDRLLNGGTVPLGLGHTDFATCFYMLRLSKYRGPFILQAARAGDEIETSRQNMLFVNTFLHE